MINFEKPLDFSHCRENLHPCVFVWCMLWHKQCFPEILPAYDAGCTPWCTEGYNLVNKK